MIESASRDDWSNVPKALIDATELRFAAAVGRGSYQLRSTREFPVADR